jgi:MFS family permease
LLTKPHTPFAAEAAMRIEALDWLNFFLADVRGGLGPFVNVYLATSAHWSAFAIGATMTTSGLIGVAAHPAVGAFIDQTHAKRETIVLGAFLLALCSVLIVTWPITPVVLMSDVVMAVLGGLFAPAIAAITLGLYDRDALPMRLARNIAFDRAGNISIALLSGAIGLVVSERAPFYVVPFFAIATAAVALSIPPGAIDDERARGFDPAAAGEEEKPANWRALLADRPLLVFVAAAALFNFANGPMLPLVAQKLALANPRFAPGFTSLSIILAQVVTIVMSMLLRRANTTGRKPLLILAFLALPLRGGLCIWLNDPVSLLLLQAMDGVGGGLFDALLPLVLADLMQGTGRYSLARGTVGAIHGAGGSLSQVVGGFIVSSAGYAAAFFALALVGAAALAIVIVLLPETKQIAQREGFESAANLRQS